MSAASAYAQTIQGTSGLVSYYRLGESGGAVIDSSGAKNGTASNVSTGASGALSGDANTAYAFNGTSSFVAVRDDPSLDLPQNLSLEAWVNPASLDGKWHTIISKARDSYLSSERQYLFGISRTNTWRGCIYVQGGEQCVTTTLTPTTGSFTHLLMVRNGTTLTLYINGVARGTISVPSGPIGGSLTAGDLSIGRLGSVHPGEYFNGKVDEVALYNLPLTSAQALDHFQKGSQTSAPTSPSGQAMPVGDLPGWRQIFTDDFSTNAPIGSFETTYRAKWDGYHDGWSDSSKTGQYFPSKVLSAHDGLLDMYVHTENGIHMGAAPVPSLPNPAGSYHGQYYGRYTVRFKADPVAGYKTAWLLWPDSNVWPQDGEIDYPEGALDGTFAAYMHRQGGTSGGDQDYFERLGTYPSWHTATTEWLPNSVTFYLDGQVVGKSTAGIPNTPLHWVLQTETYPYGGNPTNSAAGHVLIDWVAVYAYAP